ncbi:hypothetical protein NKI98_14780 [Mesorhizobium sp. M0222]|uniref:hypothetical protein n=1 Tax=Mesorhizobium sp. M0222 TaxID=2956921 RepID=UPI0033394CE8
MFLYKTGFGDNPTFAPSFADTMAKEQSQRDAAAALWDTTRDLADYRDNSNAEDIAIGEAYARRNKAIFEATGVQLPNPRKDFTEKDLQEGARIADAGGNPWSVMEGREADWQRQAGELARMKPEFAGVIGIERPIVQDAYAITRGAEEAAGAAEAQANAVGLGRGRKLASSLAGGVVGALRDPMQVATLALGGGAAAPARALGWRLLEAAVTEAAVNGGVEAGVQLASHDYKQKAGVDASLSTGLKQVGLAALFGGGFGGLLEGGRTVARLLGREVPEEVLTRAAAGEAEPGDFRTIAEALGVTPDPAAVRAADLAAEQPALDAAAFGPPPAGLTDDEAARMAAQGLRAAELPDDMRSSAIDRIVEGRKAREPIRTAVTPAGEAIPISAGDLPERGLVVANRYEDGNLYIGKPGEPHFAVDDRYPHSERGDPVTTGFVTPDGQFLDRIEALAWVNANEKTIKPSSNMAGELDALDYREQVPEGKKKGVTAQPAEVQNPPSFLAKLSPGNRAAFQASSDVNKDVALRLGRKIDELTASGSDRASQLSEKLGDILEAMNLAPEPIFVRDGAPAPEPATAEAGEVAALALTEARRPTAGEAKPVNLESTKKLSVWDAMPAAKAADGDILHATHETMIADADRTEFFGDLIAACKD